MDEIAKGNFVTIGTTQAGRRSVLVVEDDHDIREALARLLELEGYTAFQAGNGREALEFLRRHAPPCLILLDLMMPVMDGLQFRREQLKSPLLADIPVIIITADTSTANKIYDCPCLLKPLDLDVLLNTIANYCRPAE